MTKSRMKLPPGMDDQMFRYATMGRMKGEQRFETHEQDYLQIVERYLSFYDMELLSFLGDEDIERFLNFELRVTPTYYLPFRERYTNEGRWILWHFTELAGRDFAVVKIQEPEPLNNNTSIQPLDDSQLDNLLDILQDEPHLHLLVRFAIATGILPNAVDTLVLGDLDTYSGVLRVHCAPRPSTNYALAPLLRVELLDYLEGSRTEGHPKAPLFHCPEGYGGKGRRNRPRPWYALVIRDILANIGIHELSPYGWLLSTHFDQLAKAGGSDRNNNLYRTELAFLSKENIREHELQQVFTPAHHSRLKGYLSLKDPNAPGQLVLPRDFQSVLDSL